MLEHYQQKDRFLQRVNPSLKLGAVLVIIIMMVPVFDPWTPLLLFGVTVALITGLGGVHLRFLGLLLLPFLLFAFSFVWIQVVFPDERGGTILFTIGSLPVSLENVSTGVSLGMRALVFGSWSLLFVLTTEPSRFMLSLIQQCKLPPRFGYGMMAAFRFLPLFRDELRQIRTAHRIRGLGEKRGLRQLKRYFIPLMAGAIRKAERTAVAMESKGFDGSRNRTFYHRIHWNRHDAYFTGLFLLLLTTIWFVSTPWSA
ncbi:energy-coupling factor transporter transmembrane component T family protein [Salibacterium halotolerans]|uniref:Energy-coupling factor transport system permease protein n=1 Tax=Salibacterium halotolerans TaxID=1884432 RepID=A0A1I5L6G5_9BACI|nr:energy-coupling factor transporter transmembrane component T [Salibacterium halotolerans]SFO92954.1 energy-coupling factor transport system permease protein [Salibacterium halotolerans]